MNRHNEYQLENQQQRICQIDVWTPKNLKVSSQLMEDVISTLQREENVLLEHLNMQERVTSLLCSSLAWLKNSKEQPSKIEKLKTLKIVFASQNDCQLKVAEEYIKKTIYRPKITYFKEEFDIQTINEHELIFITKDSLIFCEQEDFKNSILIFDNFECFQDQQVLIKISVSTIQNAIKELDDLASKRKQDNTFLNYSQNFQIIQKSMEYFQQQFQQFQFQNDFQQFKRQKYPIINRIEQYLIKQALSLNQYVQICQKIWKLSNSHKLNYLSNWFQFIKVTSKISLNQDYQVNYQSYITNTKKMGNQVSIVFKQNSQYILDHLRNLKFQSIILSSQCLYSPYDDFLNKIQFKHKIDKNEYFQTFYIQSDDKNKSLFKTLNSIQKAIPNSILVIFERQQDIDKFKKYCEDEQQSNILLEIEKNKKLFWAHLKYKIKDFLTSSRQGAILFETYSGIFKKGFNSPNAFQFCKGLILVSMNKPIYYKGGQYYYQENNENLNFFYNRSFNKIVVRTLLQENKNRVLIIYDKSDEIMNWIEICDIFQLNYFENLNEHIINMMKCQCQYQQFNEIEVPNNQTQQKQQIQQNIDVNTTLNLKNEEMDVESDDSSSFEEFTFQN